MILKSVLRKVTNAGLFRRLIHEGLQLLECEHLEPYGFSTYPLEGAETLTCTVNADSTQRYVILVADRRYRIPLQQGEVALHNFTGSKIHLKANGDITLSYADNAPIGVARIGDNIEVNDASLIAYINALHTALNSWVPVPNDGGLALKTALAPLLNLGAPANPYNGNITTGSSKIKCS